MPHCVIEHSSDIEPLELIEQVFEGALESSLFGDVGDDIKVRASAIDNFRVGNSQDRFVHVTLKILSGRMQEQKQALSQLVLSKLVDLSLSGCSISVEVVDIERASYAKKII